MGVILIVFACILVVVLLIMALGFALSAPGYKGAIRPNFNGKKFFNPTGIQVKGFRELIKWARTRKKGRWENRGAKDFPPPPASVNTGIRITFVNHSTFLIQTNGLNIITDPIWSKRASPFSWSGPKRMSQPGLSITRLPKIDLILISHNHYDHLDIDTVKRIAARDQPRVLTPLGVKDYLDNHGLEKVFEVDWYETDARLSPLEITCVPAQHFSARGMFDRNTTLWCGYMLRFKDRKVFFAGDTGYNPYTFREIGDRFGPVDIALLPIGAFKPQWFMSPIHCSPEEAVTIHREVRAVTSIASHFGTFPLADDGQDEPVDLLKEALARENLPAEEFIALENGAAYVA